MENLPGRKQERQRNDQRNASPFSLSSREGLASTIAVTLFGTGHTGFSWGWQAQSILIGQREVILCPLKGQELYYVTHMPPPKLFTHLASGRGIGDQNLEENSVDICQGFWVDLANGEREEEGNGLITHGTGLQLCPRSPKS